MTFVKQIAGATALSAALLLGQPSAQAGYVVTLQEVGGDVVATGSGPIDLDGLTFDGSGNPPSFIEPEDAVIITGPASSTDIDIYTGFTGPASFGSGAQMIFADSGSGDHVGIAGSTIELAVPLGYDSGDPLSNTATYLNETFISLGVTPGTYVWTWGDGGENQNFTLIIAAIPEPASAALLGAALALAGFGIFGRRRREAT
jgi:hypothetical protein